MTEYYCKYCDYRTIYKTNYKRHNSSESHKNNVMSKECELPIESISDKEYTCEPCNFVTVSKYNYDRHISSVKHNKDTVLEKGNNHSCVYCEACYSTASGLWRHKKQCSQITPGMDKCKTNTTIDKSQDISNIFTPQFVIELLNKNTELQNIIIDQGKQMIELAKSQQPHNNTNNSNNTTTNNNQKFNLNFFLNETCKDAINFSEFMNSIKVTLEDLEKTSQLGYVDGISRIFINALKNTDMEHRPLHCTDIKRETVYIKEGNKWDKENKEQENLKRAVEYISNKNLGQIQEWKKENPESMDFNHPKSEVLDTMYTASLSKDPEKEDSKIIHKVLNEVALEKDMVVS